MNDQPTPSQLVYSLWKAGHLNFEHAKAVQTQVAQASTALQQSSTKLPAEMARHLDQQLPAAAAQAARMIASQWTEANTHAERATKAYQEATANARKVVYGGAAVMLTILTIAVLVLTKWILPNSDELTRLREEKTQLQMTIDQLTRNGARANVQPCTDRSGRDRLCVRVDESVKIGSGLRVIKGY